MIEGNLLIRASAGTGKTFSLATRFIRLMLFDGVEPERIVALTFSRAAAQEIYTALLKRLWKAASSVDGAEEERENLLDRLPADKRGEAEALGIEWSPQTFVDLLRKVINVQHLGAIATLDSFILRLVGNFPLEMGFQHAVEVLDQIGEKEAVESAARTILGQPKETDDFVQAFRAARGGSFDRQCMTILGSIMEREGWRKFILEHPECRGWTVDSMARALGLTPFDGFGDSGTATAGVLGMVTEKDAVKWLQKVHDYLLAVEPGESPIPTGSTIASEFVRAVVRHPDQPFVEHKQKGGEIERREYPQQVFDAVHADLERLADAFLRRQLEVVEAKIRLMSFIEREYDVQTRRTGKLTFQDFTNVAGDDVGLELDNLRFRFDSKLDHWALDEFQDTSEVQWACLRSLVESAASGGGGRSVIAVGDLKQSIYTWRGGDDKPFEEMMGWRWFTRDEQSGDDYGRIENNKVSYRYGKCTADFINAVFGPENLGTPGLIPTARSAALKRWLGEDCWLEHIAECKSDGTPKVRDYVKVVAVPPDDELKDEEIILSALYRELAPVWERRQQAGSHESIGVLVRRNQDGVKVAEYLRNQGLPVVWEGMNTIADMPVVQAVLGLLWLSEHPEDTFAWKMVDQLLPLRKILLPECKSAAEVSANVAERLSHQGMARTLKDFCVTLCAEKSGLDGLSRLRLRSLVRLGVDYESRRSSGYDVDGFVRFVSATSKRESPASAGAIRILSIHRSKGLTLDRVFVPLFVTKQSSIGDLNGSEPLYAKDSPWVLPRMSPDVAMLKSSTNSVLEAQLDARLLEQLRTHYVALTRSRKALYVLFSADEHKELRFSDLVTNAVAGGANCRRAGTDVLMESGEEPPFESATATTQPSRRWTFGPAEPRIWRTSPSRSPHSNQGSGGKPLTADTLFGAAFGMAARRGVDIHSTYQKIEWADRATAESMPASFREAFVKSSDDSVVWRERSYELFDGRCWETGQFDRVVFSGTGDRRTATIYDFKTNARGEGESEESFASRMRETYEPQMAAYRRALMRMTGLPPERVSARLLLVSTGQSVDFARRIPVG